MVARVYLPLQTCSVFDVAHWSGAVDSFYHPGMEAGGVFSSRVLKHPLDVAHKESGMSGLQMGLGWSRETQFDSDAGSP